VAISSFGRSQLCRWAAHPDWARIHVVHCGVEPARFPNPRPCPRAGRGWSRSAASPSRRGSSCSWRRSPARAPAVPRFI
jgi:hypothetical protein